MCPKEDLYLHHDKVRPGNLISSKELEMSNNKIRQLIKGL